MAYRVDVPASEHGRARSSIAELVLGAAANINTWRLVLLVGVGLRLLWWACLPADRCADYSDEISYYRSGLKLYNEGIQELYWPPLAGWLVALTTLVTHATSIKAIRLVWVALDTANLALISRLVPVFAGRAFAKDPRRLRELINLSTLFYAVYLPAVTFSCITTTEVPTTFFLLLGLAFLGDWRSVGAARALAGGLSFGFMGLARVSTLTTIPLAVLYML